MNEYEIQCTCKYEGTYTPEEVEWNNRLYSECIKEVPDYAAIETLLKQGADPLGATAVSGWGLLEHIYGEILFDARDNLPQITELFLKYGMDIDNPRIPYDDDNSLHPMWRFAFITDENAAFALEMLLDKGLSADAAGEMWGHAVFDLLNIECGDPNSDAFWKQKCEWTMKMIMLCASCDHILSSDEDLQRFIGCAYNRYDIRKFRKWQDFRYEFDTSHCETQPEFCKSIVRIFEKESHREVWRIGICLNPEELLPLPAII